MSTSTIWNNLASSSVYAAVVPIVFGGILTIFKLWIPSEDDVRNRIGLRKQALRESVNKLLHSFLTRALLDLDPKKLRGAPPGEPDGIADYTNEMFRVFTVIGRLDRVHRRIKRIHSFFFITVAAGILGVLLSLLVEDVKPYVALLCHGLVVTQICGVGRMRSLSKQIEEYEKTT